MSKSIPLNTPAPEFQLEDFTGKAISIRDFLGKKNVVLIFNRSFL